MSSILNREGRVALISESEFEELVSQSLNVFTRASAGKLESQMLAFMKHIRNMLNLDICNYYSFSVKTATISLAFSSRRKGLKNYLKKENFQNIPLSKFPFLSSRLLHGRPLIIRSSADLKYFSEDFLKTWEIASVKSALYVPVEVKEKIYGFLGFGHVESSINWSQLDIRRLHTLCNILANALDRISNLNKLKEATNKLRDLKRLLKNANPLEKANIQDVNDLDMFIGKSSRVKKVIADIRQLTHSLNPVFISGEIGTGKKCFAMILHKAGQLADKPFVQIDCASLRSDQEGLPSRQDRDGWLDLSSSIQSKLSDGGFLYFDHIEEMPLILQAKIVDLLKDGRLKKKSIRVICATREKIEDLVQHLDFRSDLYHHQDVHKIHLPPLRQRREDIPDLVSHFVDKLGEKLGFRNIEVPPSALEKLLRYSWPGNVLELKNVIERIVLVGGGAVLATSELFDNGTFKQEIEDEGLSLETVTRNYITRVLKKCNWKVEGPGGASELLKVNSSTLRSRIRKLDIKKPVRIR